MRDIARTSYRRSHVAEKRYRARMLSCKSPELHVAWNNRSYLIMPCPCSAIAGFEYESGIVGFAAQGETASRYHRMLTRGSYVVYRS